MVLLLLPGGRVSGQTNLIRLTSDPAGELEPAISGDGPLLSSLASLDASQLTASVWDISR